MALDGIWWQIDGKSMESMALLQKECIIRYGSWKIAKTVNKWAGTWDLGHITLITSVSEQARFIHKLTRPRGYKTFFVLNSTKHEISAAH